MNKYGIIAIHGGNIEPGTSEIAKNIAGLDYFFYSNENGKHIPSTEFELPTLKEIDTIISIHGEKNTEDSFVMIGGLDKELGEKIKFNLEKSGFITKTPPENLDGDSKENICNKCKGGKGVQLEISRKLRDELLNNKDLMDLFCKTIKNSLV